MYQDQRVWIWQHMRAIEQAVYGDRRISFQLTIPGLCRPIRETRYTEVYVNYHSGEASPLDAISGHYYSQKRCYYIDACNVLVVVERSACTGINTDTVSPKGQGSRREIYKSNMPPMNFVSPTQPILLLTVTDLSPESSRSG
jgi:hypothetical protein